MSFSLPPLPYAYDALEPYLDAKTLQIHHTKHHQAYINKLNQALEKAPEFQSKPLDWLLAHLSQLPEAIRTSVNNNGGGHYAHSLYWEVMKPRGGGEPTDALRKAIDAQFGSFATFKERFTEVAVNHFASGWAWLSLDRTGKLLVHSTHDHDCPISQGLEPLFVVDLWEHAYYLNYQNERPRYVASLWNVFNWETVNRRLLKAQSGS